MSYDFDAAPDSKPPIVTTYVPHPTDLEYIVMLLEVAALYLTPTDGAEFTFKQLLDRARIMGGVDGSIDEVDARIVVDNSRCLTLVKKDLYRLAPLPLLRRAVQFRRSVQSKPVGQVTYRAARIRP